MAILLLSSFPVLHPKYKIHLVKATNGSFSSKREFFLKTTTAISFLFLSQSPNLIAFSENALASSENKSSKPIISGILNTKNWFNFFGDGFSIRVPPQFEDIMEPEDYNAGLSLYGDKAKPKKFVARFASSDGLEVLSVVNRPSNQLKITFLEAKDITDLGSLKSAARIFVPGGASLYSARAIKIKEPEGIRTYYFYEFGIDTQHIALVAAVNRGKVLIAGAAAPEEKWEEDGPKLRSAAISLTIQ